MNTKNKDNTYLEPRLSYEETCMNPLDKWKMKNESVKWLNRNGTDSQKGNQEYLKNKYVNIKHVCYH